MELKADRSIKSLSEAVGIMLERYPINHEFGCWDLKRDVARIYPKSKLTHGDTVLRRLREKRNGKGYQIKCVNPNRSLYKKVKDEKQAKTRAKAGI
jgi:hypothetical protein